MGITKAVEAARDILARPVWPGYVNDVAAALIELTTPVAPQHHGETFHCGNCQEPVCYEWAGEEFGKPQERFQPRYCSRCGRRIEWKS